MQESDLKKLKDATPFAYGAGVIQPNLAVDPGLIYELDIKDHMDHFWHRGIYDKDESKSTLNILNYNYPSISIPNLQFNHPQTATRVLTNVGSPGKYEVTVEAPPQVRVEVDPTELEFKEKDQKEKYKITFTLDSEPNDTNDYVFGSLVWKDGKHNVNSIICVKLGRTSPSSTRPKKIIAKYKRHADSD